MPFRGIAGPALQEAPATSGIRLLRLLISSSASSGHRQSEEESWWRGGIKEHGSFYSMLQAYLTALPVHNERRQIAIIAVCLFYILPTCLQIDFLTRSLETIDVHGARDRNGGMQGWIHRQLTAPSARTALAHRCLRSRLHSQKALRGTASNVGLPRRVSSRRRRQSVFS